MDTLKMDRFNVGTYLKEAKGKLDDETVKAMDKHLQELTTSGSLSLDANTMKKFKKCCRKSDDCINFAFFSIMKQLMKKHSEIRLSAFQMVDELFNRSHPFRELLITHLQTFLALTTEIEVKQPLPPPKAAANKLKTDTLHAIQQWYEKFGQGYRKLAIGYDYLKNCKHINFDDIRAQNEAERQRLENEEKRKQKIMADRLAKITKEISEFKSDILSCAQEAESCLQLLLPTPEDFLLPTEDMSTSQASGHQTNESFSITQIKSENKSHKNNSLQFQNVNENKDSTETAPASNAGEDVNCEDNSIGTDSMEEESDDDDKLQGHGFVNPAFSITIELPGTSAVSVTETTDNADVMQSLRDSSKLISTSYLPRVTRWLEVLSKNGAKEEDIKSTIDIKVLLETIKTKCVQLKLVSQDKIKAEEDSDEDFEDVPEKEGYEPRIPHHLREEYGLTEEPLSSGQSHPGLKRSVSASEYGGKRENPDTVFWNLKQRGLANIVDPTSRAAALANIKPQNCEQPTSSSQSPLEKGDSSSKSRAPVVEFGTDIAHWENPDEIEAPLVMKYDSLHRFWTPSEFESEKATKGQLAAVCNRTFSFTGTFEPVKWTCRAPLSSGSLCQRMDRFKCPFHGKIIARDEQGQPTGDAVGGTSSITPRNGLAETSGTSQTEELPPWQDPQLQKEIETATGHDLGSARSQKLLDKATRGKGKGRGKKTKSNLTDIRASTSTGRKRLEKRVFNKSSMRKVCASLDRADYKRVRDKFGNQFNYSLH